MKDEFSKENDLTQQKAFALTSNEAGERFKKEIKELVGEVLKDKRPVSVIYADKNYSVKFIKREADRVREVIPEDSADL